MHSSYFHPNHHSHLPVVHQVVEEQNHFHPSLPEEPLVFQTGFLLQSHLVLEQLQVHHQEEEVPPPALP